MDLKQILQRIETEKKHGDIAVACSRAGVLAGKPNGYSDSVFNTAKAKENFEDLTPAEELVLSEFINMLNERIDARKKLLHNVEQP